MFAILLNRRAGGSHIIVKSCLRLPHLLRDMSSIADQINPDQATAAKPIAPAGHISLASEKQARFERLVLVVTFVLIFLMAARTPLDTDMWWHLRAGEEMLRSGRVLLTDIFSYTRAGADWMNVFWLADGGMALLYRIGGYLAVSAAVALLAATSMWLAALQSEGSAVLKAIALLAGSVVASMVWSPRPQTVSLVLFALVGWVLHQYKWKGKNYIWALPLVFLLWGNIHGGYPLGLLLVVTMIAGEVFNHLLAIPTGRVLPWPSIGRLALVMLVSTLAVLVNPNGLDIWVLPVKTFGMEATKVFIPEWASPDFHNLTQQTMLWFLLLIIAAVALSGRVMDGSDLAALAAFTYLALLSRRSFGLFALVAVPVFTRSAWAALQNRRVVVPWLARLLRPQDAWPERAGERLAKRIFNLAIVALLAAAAFIKIYVVTYPALVEHYLRQAYPVDAARWLGEHRSGERLLNEYYWGGYLQWALPGFPVFIDGRADLYGDEFILEWDTLVNAGPGWQELLEKYSPDLVILQPDRLLVKALPESGWSLLYQDAQAVVFGREK